MLKSKLQNTLATIRGVSDQSYSKYHSCNNNISLLFYICHRTDTLGEPSDLMFGFFNIYTYTLKALKQLF